MMLPFVMLLAADLPNRVVPHGLGVQSGRCFSSLRDGERIVHGTHDRSGFTFERYYALESYYLGDGGGMGAYKRYGSTWCVITRGGGAFGERDLVRFGVPAATAHRLFEASALKASDHR